MKTLENKVIVITGASSGIGEAMAKVYAAQGAKVVLGARSVQKLQLLAGDIRARGGQAAYCGVDVTKPEECRELIDTAVREFGGVDVLICNAGISMRAVFDDVDLGVFGFEVRHDGISRNAAHRESQKGTPCDDRLSGVHRLERPVLGPHGRREAAGRNPARRGEDDDSR